MTTHILIDVDGVLINGEYFSQELSKAYGIPLEAIMPFFKEKFGACVLGKADLKEEIQPYLETWGWQDGVEALLKFWFSSDEEVEYPLLARMGVWRSEGLKIYLASNQEKYRRDYVMEGLCFGQHVDGAFFSCDPGMKKTDPRFFAEALRQMGVPANQVIYFDDEEENLESARSVGIPSILYAGLKDVEDWEMGRK